MEKILKLSDDCQTKSKKIALEKSCACEHFSYRCFCLALALALAKLWSYASVLSDQSAEKLCQKPHSPQGKSFCLEAAGLLTYSISAPSQPSYRPVANVPKPLFRTGRKELTAAGTVAESHGIPF